MPPGTDSIRGLERRRFLAWCTSIGVGTTLFPGVLWTRMAAAQSENITKEMVAEAEKLAGLEFTDSERESIAKRLRSQIKDYDRLREVALSNDVPPAIQFDPVLPGMNITVPDRPAKRSDVTLTPIPKNLDELAFWPVTHLAKAIETRQITSSALTEMYLARLKKYDPLLHCVVTLTEDLARAQAAKADREIAAGNYKGPLHGVPWGAKDLLAKSGYPTTWGATPYRDQTLDVDAAVVERLENAGAVLVAKLSLGALAQGDVWFGGRTRSPWNPRRGASGSSAGPGAATAAGLVGFSIGSETNGSIMSPSSVNGVSGLRPTFGRVSRYGAMALCWSMDKLGPMCRTVEDCALVFDAIYGPDGRDGSVQDWPFSWNADVKLPGLKIGYLESAFSKDAVQTGNRTRVLDDLRALGARLVPVEYPDYPTTAMWLILVVEAAAAFDELTRSNRDDLLVSQHGTAWPNTFRSARMVPAVEYIQANRIRTKLMEEMDVLMSQIDVIVTPTSTNLYLGNFTGHPMIAVPNGLSKRGEPTSIGFMGRLYDEGTLLAVAHRYQIATGHHLKHPEMPS
ncbi:MAG: amidase [Candidatus Hydrogenedentes bacterium]|nr:amidase [Candidatus Hydrogenedentota bacterium]